MELTTPHLSSEGHLYDYLHDGVLAFARIRASYTGMELWRCRSGFFDFQVDLPWYYFKTLQQFRRYIYDNYGPFDLQ